MMRLRVGTVTAGLLVAAILAGAGVLALSVMPGRQTPASVENPVELSGFQEQVLDVESKALGRRLPSTVFLPPGYVESSQRYPVLYMLHGLGGNRDEWKGFGIFDVAAAMMTSGEVPPFMIVLPEGEDGYWFNHATDGKRWGDYMVKDVVGAVDAHYRTLASREFRGIGGLSMGADGALQLALNHPEVFGSVQAHGPVLRPYELIVADYGDREYFAANDPWTLFERKPQVARGLFISLDVGDQDIWLDRVLELHQRLIELGIPHEWNLWTGGHDWDYWRVHLTDDMHTFAATFPRPKK
jgi:enterochelin esterase-like enzyme